VVRQSKRVQMIDPAHLDGNPILPPVHVEEIIATADAMRRGMVCVSLP